MTLDLATARYADFVPSMGVPVQTSLGRPKFALPYALTEEAKRLMPWALLGADLTEADFTARYRARLDKVGVSALRRLFYAISARHGGARLILLCFEDVNAGKFCHRRVFASWWKERTGHEVPELSVMTSLAGEQLALVHELEPLGKEVQR